MNFFNSELSNEQIIQIDALVAELLSNTSETICIVVVDFYGNLIASSRMLDDDETKTFARQALELFAKSAAVAKQLRHENLEQIVASTDEGLVIIVAGFGAGILASLSMSTKFARLI